MEFYLNLIGTAVTSTVSEYQFETYQGLRSERATAEEIDEAMDRLLDSFRDDTVTYRVSSGPMGIWLTECYGQEG